MNKKYKKPKSWNGLINFLENELSIIDNLSFMEWFNSNQPFIDENDFLYNIHPSSMTVQLYADWNLNNWNEIVQFSERNLFSIFNGLKNWDVIEVILKAYYRTKMGGKLMEAYIQDILNEEIIKNIIE